ncbi:universal stress protein [Marinigracilibium pacificum]|uniref:Universal stress protein n=1 Tax=Marinigracilibium pacificum TaxID=2729599 RepID=A0A848J5T9_9BACT|nr:universal stress protein [Marinigracilibium pacificum]NMM48492.1 universal stress protein [Marinigracilibium pacificum]
MIINNIVVAIDNVNSNELIEAAIAQAQAFSAKLWLIHVAAPNPDFVGYDPGPQYIRDDMASTLKKDHKFLQDLADKISESDGVETKALMIQGPTVKMILKEAEDLNADLLIIGNEDHSFMYKALIGETTSKVVQKAKIPLLIIPLGSD